MKKILISILTLFTIASFGQNPPDEFFEGLRIFDTDREKAKEQFLKAKEKDSTFFGIYQFLGLIDFFEHNFESAEKNFRKRIDLSEDNFQNTREMAYLKLIKTNLYNQDFEKAYKNALEGYKEYPENEYLRVYLEDVCRWAFYVNNNSLKKSYLSPTPKKAYKVNSIPEEYLIVRTLSIEGETVYPKGQRLINGNDILTCEYYSGEELKEIEIKFKLGWDTDDFLGQNIPNTTQIYNDTTKPIYERVGAKLVEEFKVDIMEEIEKLNVD
jgi:tetratricopeptide (TPR) repeat protein